MASLNKVMLIGNLTKDAELRYIPSGSAVLDFRLAVSRKYKKQDGSEGEETCFVDVALWGKRGEAVAQWLKKGKPLFVEGRLQLDEWEDKETHQKRSKLRVVAENIEFLGGGRGSDGGDAPREEGGSMGSMGAQGGGQRTSYAGPRTTPPSGGAGGPGRGDPYARAPQPAVAAAGSGNGGSMSGSMELQDSDIPF